MKTDAEIKEKIRATIRQYREIRYTFGQGCLFALHISALVPLVVLLIILGPTSRAGNILMPISIYLAFQLAVFYAIYERSLVRKRFHYATLAKAFIEVRNAFRKPGGAEQLREQLQEMRQELMNARGRRHKELRFRIRAFRWALED